MKIIEVYDLEVLCNFFSYTGIDRDSDEEYIYWIHDELDSPNTFESFLDHLNILAGQIGYNNLGYDYPILHYILINRELFLSINNKGRIDLIYAKSQEIIDSQDRFSHLIRLGDIKIPQLDTFKIWHFDNKAKRTSLKALQCSMNYPDVRDMPIKHDQRVRICDIKDILYYNKNDVLSTKQHYLYTIGQTEHPLYKGVDKIQLRKDIRSEFGIKCINYNDVKIGDEINKINYLNRTGKSWWDIKEDRTFRDQINLVDCIPDFVRFESKQLNEFLERLKSKSVFSTKGEFEESIVYKGVKFTFGQGGIHTVDKPREIIPKEGEILEDRDCESMYPKTIIKHNLYPAHLGLEWLEGYKWTYEQRVKAKKLSKTDKKYQAINEAYKLSLNGGGFGKTGESWSWQYDIFVTMFTTISNQLSLLMLCEKYLDNNIDIISANTDGVLILYKENQQSLVNSIDSEWQSLVKHTLEYSRYIKFVQLSVNDYMAIKPDGTTKYKGDFEIDKELHKNNSFRIIPITLSKYFNENIPISSTIHSHSDIYDFCARERFNSDSYGELRCVNLDKNNNPVLIKDLQQKTVRYYISKKGSTFVKVYMSSLSQEFIERDYNVTVFNQYIGKPFKEYDINYQYYITKCRKIIDRIQDKQTKLL